MQKARRARAIAVTKAEDARVLRLLALSAGATAVLLALQAVF